MIGIADDVMERYVFAVIDANQPDRPLLNKRLDELHPTMTEAGVMGIESWISTACGAAIDDLRRAIAQGLESRGYPP